MKLIYLLSGVLFCCCSFSNCDQDENIACIEFREEVIALDPDPVHATNFVNALLGTLLPNPTAEDPTGHQDNLLLFADELGQHCDIDVMVECYACIETLPAQSHVIVNLDSAGVIVSRTLDISTPDDAVMTLLGIHD